MASRTRVARPRRGAPREETRLLNRELSWVEFNARVLELARDERMPLLERMRFLAIFSSNLDEFYMVRVAGLLEQARAGTGRRPAPGELSLDEVLDEIAERTERLIHEQSRVLDELLPELARRGMQLVSLAECDDGERAELAAAFLGVIFPVLTPLAVGPGRPFPYISNLSLSLGVLVRDPLSGDRRFARVKVPEVLPRFWPVGEGGRYLPLEQLIAAHLGTLFPGMEIEESSAFRVTRDADLEIDDAVRRPAAGDGDRASATALRRCRAPRDRGPHLPRDARAADPPPRGDRPPRVLDRRAARLRRPHRARLGRAVRSCSSRSGRASRRPSCSRPERASTPTSSRSCARATCSCTTPTSASTPRSRPSCARPSTIPTCSRSSTRSTARRGDSPMVPMLIRAAEQGKQAVVLVELKARFDEERNIGWARALERAGVHVVYGFVGLKTHAKCALVVRREGGGIRRYVHIGTGNYHPRTARLYTDFGLLTCRRRPRRGRRRPVQLPHRLRAPAALPQAARGPARPARADPRRDLAVPSRATPTSTRRAHRDEDELARRPPDHRGALRAPRRPASAIDLIVRGICCLRPGVPGLSESIRVVSLARTLPRARARLPVHGRRRARVRASARPT